MNRVIRFLGVLPLLFVSGNAAPPRVIPEAQEIPNWPAPPYWTPPAARVLGEARTKSLTTASAPLPFIAITPCRQYDSRNFTPLPQDISRAVVLSGAPCGVPSSAVAVSVNITIFNIIGATGNGVFQVGTAEAPTSAWINFPPTEVQRSNAGALPLDDSDQIWVRVEMGSGQLDLTVDVNGYYDGSGTLQLSQSRRAILDQFWTPQNDAVLGFTAVGTTPQLVRSDGADLWVANLGGSVSRVRGSDGKLLETWTGATNAVGVLVAMGRIFVTGGRSPGQLYLIDPSQPPGAVTTVASNLGGNSQGIAFDGAHIWTVNFSGGVSIVTPGASLPWTVTNVTAGFLHPLGAVYDGVNVWVTDYVAGTLLKLDGAGAILQTVTVGGDPSFPIFDGTNIWVPNYVSDSVSVVRASTGAVMATLTGNGLNRPSVAAFDGQRILVTNFSGNSVSLWKAADLTPLGSFSTGPPAGPLGACSDGIRFWITFSATNKLARF
jgi:hypothetical protein